MRFVFLGAPGVGKGTQAERLAKRCGTPKISTGDILREAVADRSPMGEQVKSYLDAGHLVPDTVMIGVVEERLLREDVKRGFILDGFPRTVPQAEALGEMLSKNSHSIDAVIQLEAPEQDILSRISGRVSCPSCQKVWHLEHNLPPRYDDKKGPICSCGTPLKQRLDDTAETVRERLKVYEKQTAPLVEYYRNKNLLIQVDASNSIETVTQELLKRLSFS